MYGLTYFICFAVNHWIDGYPHLLVYDIYLIQLCYIKATSIVEVNNTYKL